MWEVKVREDGDKIALVVIALLPPSGGDIHAGRCGEWGFKAPLYLIRQHQYREREHSASSWLNE